jgi:hypothetical protein
MPTATEAGGRWPRKEEEGNQGKVLFPAALHYTEQTFNFKSPAGKFFLIRKVTFPGASRVNP